MGAFRVVERERQKVYMGGGGGETTLFIENGREVRGVGGGERPTTAARR